MQKIIQPVAEDVPVVIRCVGFATWHLLLSEFVISFAVKTFFQILCSSGILLPDGISRTRRETEEGSKSHHTLFRWVYSFCVASLTGRWSIGCLVTALRGLRPLVPCYARSLPIGTSHDANITASRASLQGRDMHNTVQATGRSAVIVI